MVSPGARRYIANVCSASFSLSSCKPQKTQELLRYDLLQMVYAIASPPVYPSPVSHARDGAPENSSPRTPNGASWQQPRASDRGRYQTPGTGDQQQSEYPRCYRQTPRRDSA